ncbi:MAG: hypothetical protein JO256_08180, partial [Alphaproteobacteria bacterium]|nr:hypothetical protein [Alphaproteobacteria bacterium]
SGLVRVKELRPPLWLLSARSRWLKPSEVRAWSARLESLDNGKGLFYGYDFAAYYPLNYPNGTWPTGGSFSGTSVAISAIANGKTLSLKSLPAGYQGAVGDMIRATRASDGVLCLYRAMEAFTANGSGITGNFEVRPAVRTGQAVNDAVAVKNPSCVMALVPGSLSVPDAVNGGVISFKASQAQ